MGPWVARGERGCRCGHSWEMLERNWSDLASIGFDVGRKGLARPSQRGREVGKGLSFWGSCQARPGREDVERGLLYGGVSVAHGITETVRAGVKTLGKGQGWGESPQYTHSHSPPPGPCTRRHSFASHLPSLGQFSHSPFILSPHLSPLLPVVLSCSVSCPKPPEPLVDFAAVSHLRRLLWPPLSPERPWAAKGGQSPQVNPLSAGAALPGVGGRQGPRWGLGSVLHFPSMAGGLRGRGGGRAALCGPQHVWGLGNRLVKQQGCLGAKCPLP